MMAKKTASTKVTGVQPSQKMPMKVQAVAKGKGAPVASDGSGSNHRAPLNAPGIAKGAPVKTGLLKNAVPSGKGSPAGQRAPAANGSTGKGQSQKITATPGAVGKLPAKVSATDKAPTPENRVKKIKDGGKNRFDMYADARK